MLQQQPDERGCFSVDTAQRDNLRDRQWASRFVMPVIAFIGVSWIKHIAVPFGILLRISVQSWNSSRSNNECRGPFAYYLLFYLKSSVLLYHGRYRFQY